MADIKISELDPAAQANTTDLLETSQVNGPGYLTKKLTLAQVTALVPPTTWATIPGKPTTFPPTLPINESDVTNLVSDLAAKAPLASPTFTGDPKAPTPATSDNDTSIATTAYVKAQAYVTGGPYLPLAGGTLTGPVVSNLTSAPNQSGYRVTNYSLTGTNTASAFRIDGTLNVSSGIQPDIFAINLSDTSNQGGSAFVIKAGPTAGNTIMRCDMAGDLQNSGWSQCMSGSGLPAGGAYYFASYIGNNSGGNVGTFAGTGAPSGLDTFGRYGSIYLNAASPGIPYYNNNGSTGWDQLVGLSATQTLTNKSATTPAPGDNTTKIATTAYVQAALAAGASISVGDTPPGSPGANALYWNSVLGTLFLYYNDGNTSQWVPASPSAQSGTVLQTVSFETGASATSTALIPIDDTIPQITEGNEYMTLAITPRSATSKLIIDVIAVFGTAVAGQMVLALFQDSTANALAVTTQLMDTTNGRMLTIPLRHSMTSGTTSATTFRVRAGQGNAGTTTFNGTSSVRQFGGAMASSIVIQEVL